ncbi:protein FLX-like 3 [Iris pallida]|uniref:Protein FLX-like 3 n=1 Tax=Iris pallida TaxID=29817 RepID=A0AAX6DY10_IRIPA|nr:protein FLX-like 3 [Iris pallida]
MNVPSAESIMAGRGRMPHHSRHDEMQGFRDGPLPHLAQGRGPMPPPLRAMEEDIAMRHDEIRRLHAENRRMIEDNVAMRRDLSAAKEELHVLSQAIPKVRADKELKARELIQMGLKLEAELRSLEPVKAEVLQLQSEAQKLDAMCQEMSAKVQSMSQDLKHLQAENQQIPSLKMEVDGLRQDLVRARTAYEYEKKANAEQMEQRQAMEKNLVSMARETEKLRAEQMNMEKRTRGPGIGAYGADMGYTGSLDGYGAEKGLYGAGSWGSYESRGLPRK